MTPLSSSGGIVRIDIAVCTYRRPELEQTLRSLGFLSVPENAALRIIVADNDATPSAKGLVEKMKATLPFEVVYVHCPASNISIARNACLDHATGDFLAFIDDDETASEDWLAELVKTARLTGADVVLGPVRSIYAANAPDWMRNGDFHSTLPVWVGGEIRTGYTCNVLLRRTSSALADCRFNLALGRSGGEDTEFFDHAHRGGGRIVFAPQAFVYEPVPQTRASLGWLVKRRFRFGQTHGRLLHGKSGGISRIRNIALASAKSAYCFGAAVLLFPRPVPRNRYALRGIMHAGVVTGLFGMNEIQQYGAVEKAA